LGEDESQLPLSYQLCLAFDTAIELDIYGIMMNSYDRMTILFKCCYLGLVCYCLFANSCYWSYHSL